MIGFLAQIRKTIFSIGGHEEKNTLNEETAGEREGDGAGEGK